MLASAVLLRPKGASELDLLTTAAAPAEHNGANCAGDARQVGADVRTGEHFAAREQHVSTGTGGAAQQERQPMPRARTRGSSPVR